jgi:hypothetical protein
VSKDLAKYASNDPRKKKVRENVKWKRDTQTSKTKRGEEERKEKFHHNCSMEPFSPLLSLKSASTSSRKNSNEAPAVVLCRGMLEKSVTRMSNAERLPAIVCVPKAARIGVNITRADCVTRAPCITLQSGLITVWHVNGEVVITIEVRALLN